MPRFDAELYLRLIGEEMLLDARRERGGWSSPLDDAAGALVAVGAITAAMAQRVLRDYSLAQSLRSGDGHHHIARMRRLPRAKARTLRFKRAVPVDIVIEDPHGRLEIRYVTIGDQEISLAIVHRPPPEPRSTRRGTGRMMFGRGAGLPWGAPAPTLTWAPVEISVQEWE